MIIPAIVLAAGASTRLGQPKQLVSYLGETLLVRAIRLARQAGADPVLAVLGARHEVMLAGVQRAFGTPVINPQWQQGIASSIHAGLGMVDTDCPDCPGVLILTCDQPKLSAAHLTALLGAFSAQAEPSIAASAYKGTLGTPAVFPRCLFPQLLALQGDSGARKLLNNQFCPIATVPLPGGEIDIDTPADLDSLR
jgi:molybdenum cofactor cytidylyltransferase